MFTRSASPSPLRRRFGRPLSLVVVALTLVALALTGSPLIASASGYGLPSNVQPPLSKASTDYESIWHNGCLAFESATVPKSSCVFGDKSGSFVVALVGDSHASHLFPAVESLAKSRGWKLVVMVKTNCAFTDMRLRDPLSLSHEYYACKTWNKNVLKRLTALKPDLTLAAMSHLTIHPWFSSDNTNARKGAAVGRELTAATGVHKAIIVDAPYAGIDVPACLAAHKSDIRKCAFSKTTAYAGQLGNLEQTAATASGAADINLTKATCPAWPCQVVSNNRIIYRDNHHFTATFARSLAPALGLKLDAILN